MGLSILIPVYNYDVTVLVNTLSRQLNQTGIAAEIVLLDDGSQTSFDHINQPLSQIPFVKYSRNAVNAGRTVTRKLLAKAAQFDYLLFLDCDSTIIHDDFIKIYYEKVESNALLVSGGRIYNSDIPDICNYRLHWKYGSRRESGMGKKKNGPAFMSHNFLVKKTLFLQLDFTKQLKGYGHEDSLWGIQFRQMGVMMKQVNNPVLHASLEETGIYLIKTEQALGNLLMLQSMVHEEYLIKEIKIYKWYKRLCSIGLAGVFSIMERPFHSMIRANLESCNPSLFLFDLYRLAVLIRISGKKNSISGNSD